MHGSIEKIEKTKLN